MNDGSFPNAKSACSPEVREKVRRAVARLGLCGLANDTKWDEFIDAIRAREDWRPSYRVKCIEGPPSQWDVEWFYHLPFPLISVEWLDISHLQETREHRIPPRINVIDHSEWIVPLLTGIGLDFQVGTSMIRIFGYSPRNLDLFDQ